MNRETFEIRELYRDEWEDAIQLAWDTFLIFEAPEYGRDGIKSFKRFIRDPMLKRMFIIGGFQVYGAFEQRTGNIIGVLGIRGGSHISLLFVQAEYHHRGIARDLMNMFYREACRNNISRITVHSSAFAVGFYHKLGFTDIDTEVYNDGIWYVPMEYVIPRQNVYRSRRILGNG
ncbi:MAG: GNAT family N-acetyltransferase [Lachnospiraceae bacterium]|nr:GNAT family N-acetyltransferase [Lachnospiraceae bacterium]